MKHLYPYYNGSRIKRLLPGILVLAAVCVVFPAHAQHAAASAAKKSDSAGVKENFTRSEERYILAGTSKEELLKKIRASKNRVELRAVSKELGDRAIQGKLKLSPAEQQLVNSTVAESFELIKSESSNDREQAVSQIHRLWHLAAPKLLEMLDSKDVAQTELAAKSLILMRNETIIKEIIGKAQNEKDEKKKKLYVFVLSKMQEQRTSMVPGRSCMDAAKSKELYDRLVAPAMSTLNPAEPKKENETQH